MVLVALLCLLLGVTLRGRVGDMIDLEHDLAPSPKKHAVTWGGLSQPEGKTMTARCIALVASLGAQIDETGSMTKGVCTCTLPCRELAERCCA
ncbi:hypothetical protein GCM10009767_28610 [Kocuria aegyptia]|uniref:Uncharacterized protein n=1 Tax=Kocuria aegyptia TaxID=330943 RepID=A0ABN2KXJ0_9MICC